eukprot:3645268-Rhodomonas_salina.2
MPRRSGCRGGRYAETVDENLAQFLPFRELVFHVGSLGLQGMLSLSERKGSSIMHTRMLPC